VPLFQEQAMRIAIVGAGFSPEEADRLRRSMATFKQGGEVHRFRGEFLRGMLANGYEEGFATRCFDQIEGFGTYGFPESHAASFALLVYVSAWLKCRHPEIFACALLNSQPMGFYAPAQIVRDARDHGVLVRPVDVGRSDWDCTLEPAGDGAGMGSFALRLGLRLAQAEAQGLVAARGAGYRDAPELWRRSGLGRAALERLAEADALRSLGLDRRGALWALKALGEPALPLFAAADRGPQARPAASEASAGEASAAALLPVMPLGEHVVADYASTGLSLKRHPLAFLRPELAAAGYVAAADLAALPPGSRPAVAGLVLVRQRPGSANGVVFITLEDETGIANLIVWPDRLERFRRAALGARLLGCRGRLQREESVLHLVAEDLRDLTPRLETLRARDGDPRGLVVRSRDFH
jgi:error-prone DNA polymerase